MSKPEFVYVTYIETTPEKLWHALTDGDFLETGRPLDIPFAALDMEGIE
jgi:hypothetical protein